MGAIRSAYGMVFIVTLVSSLVLLMFSDMNGAYHKDNINLTYLDKSQEIQKVSNDLNDAVQDLTNAEGGVSPSGVYDLITNGFVSSINIITKSFMFVPSLLGDLMGNLLPEDVNDVVSGIVTSFVILLLVFGIIYLLGGKRV